MEEIVIAGCKAEIIVVFDTFNQWVNKAGSRLGGFNKFRDVIVCLDKDGYCCHIGEDFMTARDNDRFPVTAYLLTRSVTVTK